MKKSLQVSERLYLGMLLALSGGFMDAYSYLFRGEVFANAQTGNMLLLGVHLAKLDFSGAFYYFCPVFAFAIGIIFSDIVNYRHPNEHFLHWRQISILIEAATLFAVAFFPQSCNLLANSLTSMVCGIQVESFRKIHGNGIATTMCIGNLRSGLQNFTDFIFTKNKKALQKSLIYFSIIVTFIIGAVIGSYVIRIVQAKAIMTCTVLLLIVFVLMFFNEEEPNIVEILEENIGD